MEYKLRNEKTGCMTCESVKRQIARAREARERGDQTLVWSIAHDIKMCGTRAQIDRMPKWMYNA